MCPAQDAFQQKMGPVDHGLCPDESTTSWVLRDRGTERRVAENVTEIDGGQLKLNQAT